MKKLLPQASTAAEYEKLFPKAECWLPAIQFLQEKHELKGEIKRGELGSHIVYRIGDTWVKLIFPLWEEQARIEIAGLKTVNGRTRFATPSLRGLGELEGWSYLLLSHVPGKRIGDFWADTPSKDKCSLAENIARVTKELQVLKPEKEIADRIVWNHFIEKRFHGCVKTQEEKGMAVENLRKLEKVAARFSASEFHCDKPVFLHADLTHDHFLVDGGRITGVIDFADARCGHPEYDLIAYFCFMLAAKNGGDKEAQRCFYREWGNHIDPVKQLVWSALHEFANLKNYWGEEKLTGAKDWRFLAEEFFY